MPNKLCIIEGDFDLSYLKSAKKCDSSISSLNELIDWYKSKSSERVAESSTGENSNDYVVINSADGSELCASLLQDMSTTYDIDATLINNNTIINANNNPNESKLVSRVSSSSFVCFLLNDFNQEDSVFLKLEETQSKISSILNAINNTTLNTSNTTMINNSSSRILIFGWPILNHCYESNLSLLNASDIDRPLYCKSMSGCFVCFTGFKKENKHMVAQCIKLVHYMGGSVRKEYNKKITHLIVKSTLSTKYKTAYNIGRCHLLTEDWILNSWNHRNQVDFNVNDEEFLKKFRLKALYSLVIAFYGFTKEETQHMKEVTIENGGTPISDYDDPQCTHIVINDQEIKYRPCLDLDKDGENSIDSSGSGTNSSPAKQIDVAFHKNLPPFSNTRALIVKAEWFWASIQICCRASECLYEFTKPKEENIGGLNTISATKLNGQDPPNKRIKLSSDNLLSNEIMNSNAASNSTLKSPHPSHLSSTSKTPTQLYAVQSSECNKLAANNSSSGLAANQTKVSSNNLLSNVVCENDYESPSVVNSNHNINTRRSRNKNNLSCNNLSTSASLLDATTDDAMSVDSPFEKQRESAGHGILNSASSNGTNNTKKINKRSQRIIELYETEKRFVNILHTIIYIFKEPIESPDQVAGPILDQTEVKEIFGNLPPIYEVHCKIKDRLEKLANRIFLNDESSSVGEIYLDNADSLLKTYPPFVNFYEKTKDAILTADKLKPRFHAFLKIAQSKPECGRQTLVELFIRPVQRLPSTLLLLDDILKETPKGHRDLDLLTKAIASLKEVMTHINEDKRKIENQLAMFVLINDIENCPATLLSSHRIFLKKLDVYEMSSELHKKGAQLTLFLFTDCLEICKPRLKLLNAAKSPNAGAKQRTPQKCYKHIALFSLNNITKVCDILQNNDDTDLFGILCRLAGEKDKFFSFKVIASNTSSQQNQSSSLGTSSFNSVSTANLANNTCTNTSTISSSSSTMSTNTYSNIYSSTTNLNTNDEHYQAQLEKKEYIKMLAQGICNVKCITEYENILCTIEAKQLQIDLNESGGSKKLDAVKSYARIINRRVSRAFSFSQDTPNKIKKTISSVFRSPFQSSYSQQSLNDQKASKLTSLASLQLTPTLLESKRKFITLQKSTLPLISPPPNKQNQPKRGSHTIHLLSTRTLKNLRSSTTTSTINGVSSSSSRSSNTQSTSSFSLTASLASIHKSSSMFKRSKNKNAKKSELQENGSYLNGEDEPTPSTDDLQYYSENNYTDMFDTNEDDYEEETNETGSNSDDFDDDLEDIENMTPKNLEKELDIGQASSNLITNLFSASKKKSSKFLSANSIKNLKKKSSLKSTKSSTASTGEEKNCDSVLGESKNTSLISGINQLENVSN